MEAAIARSWNERERHILGSSFQTICQRSSERPVMEENLKIVDSAVRYNAEELRADPKLEARCVKAYREDKAIEIPKRKGRWYIRSITHGMDVNLGRWLTLGLDAAD